MGRLVRTYKTGLSFGWGDYMLREIAGAAPSAFVKFELFGPLANHRRKLPKEAWHLARLALTRFEAVPARNLPAEN